MIRDQLIEISKQAFKSERMYSEVCTVVSVSGRVAVCNPIDDSAQIKKARLQAIGAQSLGMVLVPKVGSYVIVSFIDKVNGFITSTTELEEILIDTNLVTFNGGTNDGLVKVNDLVTKLNNLENKVNSLITYTSVHTHTGVTTGAGVSGTSATPVTGSLTPTVKADLENTKIKQ